MDPARDSSSSDVRQRLVAARRQLPSGRRPRTINARGVDELAGRLTNRAAIATEERREEEREAELHLRVDRWAAGLSPKETLRVTQSEADKLISYAEERARAERRNARAILRRNRSVCRAPRVARPRERRPSTRRSTRSSRSRSRSSGKSGLADPPPRRGRPCGGAQ